MVNVYVYTILGNYVRSYNCYNSLDNNIEFKK